MYLYATGTVVIAFILLLLVLASVVHGISAGLLTSPRSTAFLTGDASTLTAISIPLGFDFYLTEANIISISPLNRPEFVNSVNFHDVTTSIVF